MYKLKELSYSYDTLEPYIDTHTIGLHYHKHAQNYLNKLNSILDSIHYDYRYSLEELSLHIHEFPEDVQQDILFNLGGVINHEIYFDSINPKVEKPQGAFLEQLNQSFGNYDNFKKLFKDSALKIKGSGYTFLVIDKNHNLRIINLSNQDNPYIYQFIPLINIDMWEHAYYINYENNKDTYIDNFFNIIDFSIPNHLFQSKSTRVFP